MKKITTFLSRISVRVFAFNFLIAFLPIAGVLSLGTYERQLLQSLEHALVQQARILAAALSGSEVNLKTDAVRVMDALRHRLEARIRVLDAGGGLLVDSSNLPSSADEEAAEEQALSSGWSRIIPEEQPKSAQESWLYRLASFPVRIYRKFRPPQAVMESIDFYSEARILRGPEILAALDGRYGAATRVSESSVTLYSAVPILDGNTVTGVVLISQSTYRILWDLYALRLDIFTLFLISVGAAAGFSLLVSSTITVPLRRLRDQAALILDASGRLRGRIAPTKRRDEIGDLSRRFAELTESLDRQLKTAESFASNLSHEMKNSLASIRSAAELLSAAGMTSMAAFASDLSSPWAGAHAPDREDLVAVILEDVNSMERLLTDVRELSRLEAGLPAARASSSRPGLIAEGIIEAARRHGAADGVAVRVEGQSAEAVVPPELLQRVIENLLDNAVSFSPKGGEVVVSVGDTGDSVLIAVSDQGPGIPEEDRERIFERFYTSRPPTEEGRRHAGLGLSIVKAIVEGYGGSVKAGAARDADGKERGARIEVLIPAAKAPAG